MCNNFTNSSKLSSVIILQVVLPGFSENAFIDVKASFEEPAITIKGLVLAAIIPLIFGIRCSAIPFAQLTTKGSSHSTICVPPSTGWDKSETKVTGTCVNDSLVCFTIKNRSSPPSGNMQGTAPWRLYVNDTLVAQGSYQLAGGDSLIKCYPANGKTYRLEAGRLVE